MLDASPLALANAWQRGFPLSARPFADIAAASGLAEGEVIGHFVALKEQGVIDRVGPVFRPNTVGASTLAAMAVPPERLESVATFVSEQSGVNHNYERGHRYNLWFVVTGGREADVQWTLSCLEYGTRLAVLRLPLLEEFHIDLGFDLKTGVAPRAAANRPAGQLSAHGRDLAAAVASGLPLVPAPYEEIARQLGASEAEVTELLAGMLADGRIRRIGAVIRHRRLGYESNAMVVWDVPDDEVGDAGRRVAQDPAVTLCYRRSRSMPEWSYNLYCMIHGRERNRVLYEAGRVSAVHGLGGFPRAVLFGERCFTQRAARYG